MIDKHQNVEDLLHLRWQIYKLYFLSYAYSILLKYLYVKFYKSANINIVWNKIEHLTNLYCMANYIIPKHIDFLALVITVNVRLSWWVFLWLFFQIATLDFIQISYQAVKLYFLRVRSVSKRPIRRSVIWTRTPKDLPALTDPPL